MDNEKVPNLEQFASWIEDVLMGADILSECRASAPDEMRGYWSVEGNRKRDIVRTTHCIG